MFLAWLLGHWVDALSVVTGVLYVGFIRRQRAQNLKLLSRETGLQFASGLALGPLIILFPAAFSETMMNGLMGASRITLAAASAIAVLSILEDNQPK